MQTPKRSEIYYWRTSSGIEVDFVAVKKPDIFPFKITYSTKIQDKKIKNLMYFLKMNLKAKLDLCLYGRFSLR